MAFGTAFAGAAKAACGDLVCGLIGQIGIAVQKGPHVAAEESAVQNAAAAATTAGAHDARTIVRKPKRYIRAAAKKRPTVTKRLTAPKKQRRQPPMPATLPERDPVPVVAPDEVNAIDLAAGPEPAADGEQDASADELPPNGIRTDEAARKALALALYDKAHRLRDAPTAPQAMPRLEESRVGKSWLERMWTVVADAFGAVHAAVRTLVG
ncbi:MAG: hypothetical protein FJX62_14195 [Alphaproteobacteria bacterium]|nr:hypothetical protein [Alphaproteobacteria bacterium]